MNHKEAGRVTERIVCWLDTYFEKHGVKTAVFGVSGGLDSAVVAGFLHKCKKARPIGLILPIESDPLDEKLAIKVIYDTFPIFTRTYHLEKANNALLSEIDGNDKGFSGLTKHQNSRYANGNIKARLRMIALYHMAKLTDGIVIATGNFSEFLQGFTTLHGDTGDIAPLGQLWKGSEIPAIAMSLGVPQEIIDRPPSDGLGISKTDKDQLLLDYPNLDKVLRIFLQKGLIPEISKKEIAINELPKVPGISQKIVQQVFKRMCNTSFKREMLRIPTPTRRELNLSAPYYE